MKEAGTPVAIETLVHMVLNGPGRFEAAMGLVWILEKPEAIEALITILDSGNCPAQFAAFRAMKTYPHVVKTKLTAFQPVTETGKAWKQWLLGYNSPGSNNFAPEEVIPCLKSGEV
jgi:hypothetical protein